MEVIVAAPHTSPFATALATSVVGTPLLTLKALADGIASVITAFLQGFHTSMMLVSKENAVP